MEFPSKWPYLRRYPYPNWGFPPSEPSFAVVPSWWCSAGLSGTTRYPDHPKAVIKKKTDFVHQTKYQENHTAGQTPNPWVFKLTSTKVQAGYGGILCMMICCSLNKNLMGSIPVLALQLDQWIYKITTAPNLQGTLQRVCAYGFHYERPLAATVAPW